MIAKIDITPNYFNGFTFKWQIEPDFTGPRPWTFVLQETRNHGKSWIDISEPIVNAFIYQEHVTRIYPRTDTIKFRILSTDGNKKKYTSFSIAPYAVLTKREFLLAREIMRKEILMMKRSSGTPVKLFKRDYFARAAPEGVDPISDSVIDPDFEVGDLYCGPYDLMAAFQPQTKDIKQEDSGLGHSEQFQFKMRTIGFPYINAYDVIFDDNEDRAFKVGTVVDVAEIRRMAVVQDLAVNEIEKSSPIYRLRDCI